MNKELKIDPELENLLPRLTESELQLLEDQILEEGKIRNPIVTWNGTIIDGHHRYKIALKHPEISFNVIERQFRCKEEAKLWIYKHQLSQRNATESEQRYYVGTVYEARKRMNNFVDNKYTLAQKGKTARSAPDQNTNTTRMEVAKEMKVSNSYVQRAAMYTKGINAAEEVMPGIKHKFLSEEITANIGDVARLAKLSKDARIEALRWLQAPISSRRVASPEMYENTREDIFGEVTDTIIHFLNSMEHHLSILRTLDLTDEEKEGLFEELNRAGKMLDVVMAKLR